MPAPLLLIDGYNLMYAAGLGPQRDQPGELQVGRERVVRLVSERLTAAERRRAIVVFDSRDPPRDRPTQFSIGGLRVIFALPEGDADVVLERMVDEQSAPRQVTVVSSDRQVQSAARSRRAKFESSRTFLDRLARRRTAHAGRGHDPKRDGLTAAEAETWLKAFGAIDVVEAPVEFESQSPPACEAPAVEPPPARRAARGRRGPRADRGQGPSSPGANDLQFWLGVFGHLDGVRLEGLE